jgi:hypothetical protein
MIRIDTLRWSDGTVPPRTERYLANALLVDESG